MGDLVPFSGDWREQLAELNKRATRELGQYPEPVGCPATGTWVRAAYVDDDMQQRGVGAWHLVKGWRPTWGSLQLRCASRNRTVNGALSRPGGPNQMGLTIVAEIPSADVCQRCVALYERDGKAMDPATIAIVLEWRSAIVAACEKAVAALRERGADPRMLNRELKTFDARGAQRA